MSCCLEKRYISPCEASWSIFAFPIHGRKPTIHGRKPTIERLHFHLLGQHVIFYQVHENIDDALSKPRISESMFTSWMDTNKSYAKARNLTYAEFVSKFVCLKKEDIGNLGKMVSPTTRELFYLRTMLTACKGPTSFEDLRTVANGQYPTYRALELALEANSIMECIS